MVLVYDAVNENDGSLRSFGAERMVMNMLIPIITEPARNMVPPTRRTQYMGTI